MAFFRDDLYGVQSTEQRDWDLGGLLPTLARVLPAAAIAALAHAMALNCLSERLDAELIGALRSTGSLAGITPERYGAAYRSCGRRAEREKQIVLVIDVGRTLDRLTRLRAVRVALMLAGPAARAAGFADLYEFLERGFVAFRHLGKADDFLAIIERREKGTVELLLSGSPAPFDVS